MMRAVAVTFILALALSGCGPDLGACDKNEAFRLVYDESGAPAYEGQALIVQSCGSGGFCHSPGIEVEDRLGVPAGLDYDLQLASFTTDTDVPSTERLRAMQHRVFIDRHAIWEQVASGRMPIPGAVGLEVVDAAPIYSRIDGARVATPIPGLETPEGRENLRNWLACGVPVVERTTNPTDGMERDLEPVGEVVSPQEVRPLEANWPDIYARLVDARCNSAACHGAMTPEPGELQLLGEAESLETLMNGMGQGPDVANSEGEVVLTGCVGPATPYLVPGNPEGSLFYQKLTGVAVVDGADAAVCGDRMPGTGSPITPESLANIAAWINGL